MYPYHIHIFKIKETNQTWLSFHIIGELRQGIEERNRIVCCRSAKQVNIKIAPWKLKLPRSQSEKVKVSVPHADETQNDRDHTLKHHANSQKLPNHSNTQNGFL